MDEEPHPNPPRKGGLKKSLPYRGRFRESYFYPFFNSLPDYYETQNIASLRYLTKQLPKNYQVLLYIIADVPDLLHNLIINAAKMPDRKISTDWF
jgi:hypothetical protein